MSEARDLWRFWNLKYYHMRGTPIFGLPYAPVLAIAGSLHLVAFVFLLTMARSLRQLPIG